MSTIKYYITASEVKKLRINSKLKVIWKSSKDKLLGKIIFVPSTTAIGANKIIFFPSQGSEISLDCGNEELDSMFIFERKRRLRLNPKKLTLDKFI